MNDFSAKHPVRCALFAALLAGTALSCLVSCSKPVPQTPMERSDVLLELFNNLDRKDNEKALKNIDAYRNLDQTNLFLSDFEHIVRANKVIGSVRARLDAGDIQGASEELNAFCVTYGDASPSISKAKAEVDLLLKAQALNEKMLEARLSDDLRAAATELRTFARENFLIFPDNDLYDYAKEQIREADVRYADENADACVAIFQDMLDAAGSKSGDNGTAAVLATLLELNADPEQFAGFGAWLDSEARKSANQ